MIYNIKKLNDEDRKFLIGYLDEIRNNKMSQHKLQNDYYNALKERLGIIGNVPSVSLMDIIEKDFDEQKIYFEFIVEYFFVGGQTLEEILDETELYYAESEFNEIYIDLEERLEDIYDPDLIVYQYMREVTHRADPILIDELDARVDELVEQTNELEFKRIDAQLEVMQLEEDLEKKRTEYEKQKLLYDTARDKAIRLSNRGFEEKNKVSVKVFATMSSGKSTLINGLLQQKLMPSANLACTAKITKIVDRGQEKDDFSVRAYTKEDETLLYSTSDPDYATMQMINKDTTVEYVQINKKIPFNKSEKINLSIVDTPGPNNSRNIDHEEIMSKELENLYGSIVIYIINATQFGINDDAEVLKKLHSKVTLYPTNSTKVIFVVNKMDQIDTNEEDIGEFLENVKEYLEDHEFRNPQIYPVSSLTALNIRTLLQTPNINEDDDEIYSTRALIRKLNRNKDLHLETYSYPSISSMSFRASSKIAIELQNAEENNDKIGQALIHSGIRNIEESILLMAKEIIDYNLNDDYWD